MQLCTRILDNFSQLKFKPKSICFSSKKGGAKYLPYLNQFICVNNLPIDPNPRILAQCSPCFWVLAFLFLFFLQDSSFRRWHLCVLKLFAPLSEPWFLWFGITVIYRFTNFSHSNTIVNMKTIIISIHLSQLPLTGIIPGDNFQSSSLQFSIIPILPDCPGIRMVYVEMVFKEHFFLSKHFVLDMPARLPTGKIIIGITCECNES